MCVCVCMYCIYTYTFIHIICAYIPNNDLSFVIYGFTTNKT